MERSLEEGQDTLGSKISKCGQIRRPKNAPEARSAADCHLRGVSSHFNSQRNDDTPEYPGRYNC